jgi:hypothetical protein
MLRGLVKQTIFADPTLKKTVMVVPNGCRDDTAGEARRVSSEIMAGADVPAATEFVVHDIERGGKAGAWNEVVHGMLPEDADAWIGFDADTDIQQLDGLEQLMKALSNDERLLATASVPVKDLEQQKKLTFAERLIKSNARVLDGGGSNLSGSLYVMKRENLRDLYLPRGLVGNDGFLSAMTKTDGFRRAPVEEAVRRIPSVTHIYESERTVAQVFKHQRRLTLGSAINSHLFRFMERMPPEESRVATMSRLDRENPNWIAEMIGEHQKKGMPLVPKHFLVKRWNRLRTGSLTEKIKLLPKVALGFVVDAYAYYGARAMMKKPGRGVGTW